MDPSDSAVEIEFRQRVRTFLAGNSKLAPSSDETGQPARDWHRGLYEQGFIGVSWPTEYGGGGRDAVLQFIWLQEYAASHAPALINVIGLGWAGPALLMHGSIAQRSRLLPKILDCSQVWCQLFSEPGAGSDLAGLSTRAVETDDGWVLSGQKVWTSYAMEADLGICLARTGDSKHGGLGMFIVDMAADGIEVRPIKQMDGRSTFNEVFFSDVNLAADSLIGGPSDGWKVAVSTLLYERVGLSAGAGALWGSGPDSSDLVSLVGRTSPDDAVMRDRTARLTTEAFAHRALKLRMLTQAGRDRIPGAEASVQKLFGDSWGQSLADAAIDALGLSGLLTADDPAVTDEGTWAAAELFSRALTIGGGTLEVQKSIIAERLLGLPRDKVPDSR